MEAIENYFNDITLSDEQKHAVQQIQSFLSSDAHIFLLKGYAGTGKTTLLKGIAEYVLKNDSNTVLLAPTGRAAKILNEKTGFEASTIHKAIYIFKELEEEMVDGQPENLSYRFALSENTASTNTVYIIDESSLIGDIPSNTEHLKFGSGKLLSDLLNFVNPGNKNQQKIIFVGDPAQLQPVGDSKSKALSAKHLSDRGYITEQIELKQIMRQRENSGIMANSLYYRQLLAKEKNNENKLNISFSDVQEIRPENTAKTFVNISPKPQLNKAAIITFSNRYAQLYNRMVRQIYFPEKEIPQAGDLLLITKNHYHNQLVLLNGEIVKVISVSNQIETQGASVYVNKERKKILLNFRDIEILLPENKTVVKAKIFDDLLNSYEREISFVEMKALYVNAIMRFGSKTGQNRKSDAFKRWLANDPYFNALHVKYGYALTCHKAQGGEWASAIVDFSGRVGIREAHLRWNYTAITRASEQLYVVNPPKLTAFNVAKISEIQSISKCPDEMFCFENYDTTPFHTKETHPAKRLYYFYILEKLKETEFSIVKVETKPYQEKYHLKDEKNEHTVELRHKLSGIMNVFEIRSEKSEALRKIFDLGYLNLIEYSYYSENNLLQKLYNRILEQAQLHDAQITNVVDEKWEQNYYANFFIKTNADCAYLQCYVNKEGIITNIIPKSTLAKGDTQLQAIINGLKL